MANTKKTTTKPKTEEAVVEEVKTDDSAKMIEQLMAQIAEQNKLIAEMQKASQNQTVTVEHTESKLGAKKIKCINAYNGMLNIATEPYGQGRAFQFEKLGDTRLIRFDDLADCVASYPNTFEKGYVLIADKQAVEALGLTEDYEALSDLKELKEIVRMNKQEHFDLFTGLDETMQKSYARNIAERINQKEAVDYNLLSKIKDECNIDIIKIADDLVKASQEKPKK